MIPLNRKQFPSSTADLAEALDEAAHRFVPKDGQIVEVRSRVFPYIDEIAVNLDGARFDSLPPVPPKSDRETGRVFEAAALTISGREIFISDVPLTIRVEGHDLDLHKGEDENGDAILVIEKVREGRLSISAAQPALERAIETIVRERAQGVTVDEVRVAMRARGPRSIAIDVRIQARKVFL